MKRLALLMTLLLCLSLCSCAADIAEPKSSAPGADPQTGASEPAETENTAPVITEDTADPSATAPETDPIPAPSEGDIDDATQAQINELEQSSTVRDDDVAPVEASAYCKLTVSCEALLEYQAQLTDVLLPPDGMFYSGTVVLSGGETALQLIADKLAACGLICELEGNAFQKVAAIPDELVDEMDWVVFCNDRPLDAPDTYVIQSGDVLVLSYVLDD